MDISSLTLKVRSTLSSCFGRLAVGRPDEATFDVYMSVQGREPIEASPRWTEGVDGTVGVEIAPSSADEKIDGKLNGRNILNEVNEVNP